MLPALALLMMGAILLVYRKLPYYFIPLTLFWYSCCAILFFIHRQPARIAPIPKYLFALFCFLAIIWGGIRLYKLNKKNIEGQENFLNAWQELSRNSDKLFIAPYFSIPFDDLGVFISPLKYPLPNVVFKNSLMNHAHKQVYKKYGIQSTEDLF